MEKFLYVTNTSPSACASTSPQGEAFVSSNRARKSANRCVAVCLFTPYSSTASGPPSLTREGHCKSRFWATDGCAAITDIFGRGDPSPTAVIHFLFVGEAFRLPLFDLYHCSVNSRTRDLCQFSIFNFPFSIQKALPDGKPSGSAFLYLRISN